VVSGWMTSCNPRSQHYAGGSLRSSTGKWRRLEQPKNRCHARALRRQAERLTSNPRRLRFSGHEHSHDPKEATASRRELSRITP